MTMQPKSKQWSDEHAAAWQDQGAVRAYLARPAHPEATIEFLLDRLGGRGGRILDLGTGTGEFARRLAPHVAQVSAVDVSAPMLAMARSLDGGDGGNIRWLHGRAVDVPLEPAYDLVIAGDSIHWMDWERLFGRLRKVMRPDAVLVLIGRGDDELVWYDGIRAVVPRYSVNQDWEGCEVVPELERRGLFQVLGRHRTLPHLVRQTAEVYLDLLHSRSALSRARMAPAAAAAFDALVRDVIRPHLRDGHLDLPVFSDLTWGRPGPHEASG